MSDYQELLSDVLPEWPYPVNYGKEHEVSVDILILGGGIAGCHAAINAARRGAKVAVVDKSPVIRSGNGGAGVDHWHGAVTNPCSTSTPEEFMNSIEGLGNYSLSEYSDGIVGYITCKESWDTLLDMERMGMKIRDVDDQFVNAEFRDDETKLMFAYDYKSRHAIRVMGENCKIVLYKELKKLGVAIYDRVMVTSLLTEGGKVGARVVGATGVNTRTGEFYIFKAKATLLSCAGPTALWVFSTELAGFASSFMDPNNSGDGTAIAWRAGAELALMERSERHGNMGFMYPLFGTGSPYTSWHACSIVDDNGKEVPWVDRDGNIVKTVAERAMPVPGQKLIVFCGASMPYELRGPLLSPDVPEKIRKGEYVLPFYADLPSMPEHERRMIFGMMVGQEGKSRIIYERYTKAGFDPDKDMLQVTLGPPESYGGMFGDQERPSQWREMRMGGGLVVDWDLKTSLESLYAAGFQLVNGADHAASSTTGRYAGRKMAAYIEGAEEPTIDRKQVDEEKERVYAPVKRPDGIGWKELRAGICRIMQEYCGEYKSEKILNMGLHWLDSVKESEAAKVFARNPHELWRALECFSRITVGEVIMQASLARKASSQELGFNRIDYPDIDPPGGKQIITIQLQNGKVKVGELPFKYWLQAPNAPTYEENYLKHSSP